MKKNNKKTYPLTIFLIKSEFNDIDQIVKSDLDGIDINEKSTFFYSSSLMNPPKWLELFPNLKVDKIFSSSASGLFLMKTNDRYFALAFGPSGRHHLRKGVIEERFGLITTLNSVKQNTLRCVDMETLETEGMQTRVQSSRPMATEEFGLDAERDLVKSVVGKSEEKLLGTTLVGKDSLRASVKCDFDDIESVLNKCLDQYRLDKYKTNFPWVDNLKEVKDSYKIEEYDKKLVEEVNSGSGEKLWLTIPEILDWADHGGFKYSKKKDDELLLDDIHLDSFKKYLGDKAITLDELKENSVYRFSDSNNYEKDRWRIYDCIYFEYSQDGITCVLTGGKWYEIKNDLVEEINKYWQDSSKDNQGVDFIDYSHKDENAYNQDLAKKNDAMCLDGNEITIQGKSKFEFCDVYTKDRKLIHIKRYSGSGTLSHLFNQGYVSSEFLFDPVYRKKINDKLDGDFKIQNLNNRPNLNGENYSVIYGIVSKSDGDLDLPFFSKLTFMSVSRRLTNRGHNVSIVKIKKVKSDD